MFIVEDGSIVDDANSYVDIEFVDNYFTDKLITSWQELTLEQKQARLIVATQYADARWGNLYRGKQVLDTQSLLFPRDVFFEQMSEEYKEYTIPKRFKQAICEYALCVDEETMSLTTNIEMTDQGGELKRKKEEVGAIKTEYEYFSSLSAGTNDVFSHYVLADSLIKPFLKSNTLDRCIRN